MGDLNLHPAYFADRRDAGRQLAARLRGGAFDRPVVLGLARGGVPVAFEVARELDAELDVLVARKIGFPGREELAIGAAAPGVTFLFTDAIAQWGIPRAYVDDAVQHAQRELSVLTTRYRAGQPGVPLEGRTVILVDDGIATGATMFAAIRSARQQGAARVVVAAPVCAADTASGLRGTADDLVVLDAPEDFIGVGAWYQDFSATDNAEVVNLLQRGRREREAVHDHVGGTPSPGG